ncbi:MAG: methylmalonyl-CoA mutase family protein [bacterium]
MSECYEKMVDAYFEKPSRLRTWSDFDIKTTYTPEDVSHLNYKKDIADPGKYPYTRGIHEDMYRGKYWTRREVCGYGSPADTNERFKYLVEHGQAGLDVIFDIPTMTGIDADHPRVEDDVGIQGTSLPTLKDMELLMEGIPLDRVSASLVITSYAAPVILAQYIALAQNQNIDISKLRGTIQNDPLHHRFCGYPPSMSPLELSLKMAVDIIEYCTKNMLMWYPMNINAYDLRENGINAPQEIGFSFAMAITYIEGALRRGLAIDEFAPRLAFYCSSHIDFFEEIAKLRAARRLWAKMMKERFKAKDPRSLKFRFGVHTAGCSLVPQQPLNNIIRVAYEALAAVLAGVQSLHCCSYDEPIGLPTETAHQIALRTQQILAYETGVANTTDPLGGSYYLEYLTDKIVDEAEKILDEIEGRGGMFKAIQSGWVTAEIEKAAYKYQKEIKDRERLVVGMNTFQIPPEEETAVEVHRVSHESVKEQIENLKILKKNRDNAKVKKSLDAMRRAAEKGEKENLIPPIIEAVKTYASIGEIIGTVREVYGLSYDPLGVIQSGIAHFA